ncbi:MAG: DUF885 family protein [Nitriliruptorales bacterium]|nr:DUF885 family protein [Nitriliruptorales bacterium]
MDAPRQDTAPSVRVEQVFAQLLAYLVESSPVAATQVGDHSRDAELDDWAPGEADRRLRRVDQLRQELDGIDVDECDDETGGDVLLLGDALDGIRFELGLQRAHERDPLFYLGLATQSVHELVRRDDLPAAPRAAAAGARVAQVPRLLDQARRNLIEVPQPHRELTLLRLPGATSLFGDVLPRFAPDAAEGATAAVDACKSFGAWLEEREEPAPDWRLGGELWADALRLALGVRMPADELWKRAESQLSAGHDELVELARSVLGGDATGLGGHELIRAGVAVASADHSPRTSLVPDARAVLSDVKQFVRQSGQFELPEPDALRVEEVPPFMQGAAVAYIVPAPLLETAAAHTYYLSPIPESWDDVQAQSFLREYNAYALRSVGIHEAYPGHYVQLAAAQRHPRLLRRVLWNSAFAEGWACYVERQLVDGGFGEVMTANGDRMRLISAKMSLRSIANALLDQGLHVRGWSDDDAMTLMVDQAYQEHAEAQAKLIRAKTTAGQLSTYFVGGEEMNDLRRDVERKHGAAFDAATFHADVLAQGTPPFPVLRRALLGKAA